MADQAPSWLADNDGGDSAPDAAASSSVPAPAAEPGPTLESTTTAPASASTAGAAGESSLAEQEKDLPKMIFVMRLANMALAIVMIACSVVTMITLPSPATWVLTIYATFGGLLICCLETQLKFLRVMIAMNFGFLFNAFWRFLFYVLMGSVTWAYDNLFGQIVAIAFVAVALFNTFVLCRYPSYRKMREKIAEEEDKRIEAKISSEVKKKAMKSMIGGK